MSRVLLVMMAVGASPAFASPGATDTVRTVPDQVYVLRDDPTQVEAVRQAAIERSVRSVSWLFRGFARRRLNQVATACGAYQLRVSDPEFVVLCNGETVFEWTLGQTGTWTTETGDVVDVVLVEEERGFELRFTQDGGGKTFRYIYGADGALRVSQRVHSNLLPTDLAYGLDYRVAPSPAE